MSGAMFPKIRKHVCERQVVSFPARPVSKNALNWTLRPRGVGALFGSGSSASGYIVFIVDTRPAAVSSWMMVDSFTFNLVGS